MENNLCRVHVYSIVDSTCSLLSLSLYIYIERERERERERGREGRERERERERENSYIDTGELKHMYEGVYSKFTQLI